MQGVVSGLERSRRVARHQGNSSTTVSSESITTIHMFYASLAYAIYATLEMSPSSDPNRPRTERP